MEHYFRGRSVEVREGSPAQVAARLSSNCSLAIASPRSSMKDALAVLLTSLGGFSSRRVQHNLYLSSITKYLQPSLER